MPSNQLVLYPPLLHLPSIFPSIGVFSNESALCIRWPKYWSFGSSISPSNEFSGWFPLGLTGLISLQSEGLSRVFSSTTVQKHQFFGIQTSLWSNSHICTWLQKKTIALTVQTFAGKVMSSLSNTPPRIVTAFLPRSKRLWISWLQSLFTVILESKKIKPITVFSFPTSFCDEVMGQDAMILVFWMLSSTPAFSFSSFTIIKKLFSFFLLSAVSSRPSSLFQILNSASSTLLQLLILSSISKLEHSAI